MAKQIPKWETARQQGNSQGHAKENTGFPIFNSSRKSGRELEIGLIITF